MRTVFYLSMFAILAVSTASAGLVTSSVSFTGPVTTTFNYPTAMLNQPGPFTVGNGITVSGSPTMSVGGTTYGLNANGSWASAFYWAATDSNTSAMTFDLGGLFGQVGGFMNYSPTFTSAVISAIAANGTTVLESYDLFSAAPISTPGATNGGDFRGISRPSADIRYFRLQGAYLIEHDITTGSGGTSAVPEPATMSLAGLALIGLALRLRGSASRGRA